MHTGVITHAGCWEYSARDLQAFRVFSQHPKWVITPVKPMESVVYYFYKITLSFLWVYPHNKPQAFIQSECNSRNYLEKKIACLPRLLERKNNNKVVSFSTLFERKSKSEWLKTKETNFVGRKT